MRGERATAPQGFHAIADVATGFGGLAAAVLEQVADEYGKTPVLFQATQAPDGVPGLTPEAAARNHALTLASLHELVGLYVPAECPPVRQPPWARRFQVRPWPVSGTGVVFDGSGGGGWGRERGRRARWHERPHLPDTT